MKKGGLKHASLWKRAIAYLIDSLIIGFIVLWPIKSAVKANGFMGMKEIFKAAPVFSLKIGIISLIISIITVLYWAIMEYKLSQSVGKIVLGIKVVSRRKDLVFKQCVIRNLTKFSSFLLFLDTLYMIIRKQHQRFFEKLSDTEVIEVDRTKTP